MHRDVDIILCKPLNGGINRNQGSDSASLQSSLAVFAGDIGINAGVFLIIEFIKIYRIPVIADRRFLCSGRGIGVADDVRRSAVYLKTIGQLSDGTIAYACEPLAVAI